MIITNLIQFFRSLVLGASADAEVSGIVPPPWWCGGMHFCQEWDLLVVWPSFPLTSDSEWGADPLHCRCGVICHSPIMTFMGAARAKGADPGDIADWVDYWNTGLVGWGRPLRELLGMSQVEYFAWAHDNNIELVPYRPKENHE